MTCVTCAVTCATKTSIVSIRLGPMSATVKPVYEGNSMVCLDTNECADHNICYNSVK